MAELKVLDKTISVSEDGYFNDSSVWTKEIAAEMAKQMNIEFTPKHLEVLEFIRKVFVSGEALTIRKVGNSGVTNIKEFYQLFPGAPLKIASKLAGIPKPSSCV